MEYSTAMYIAQIGLSVIAGVGAPCLARAGRPAATVANVLSLSLLVGLPMARFIVPPMIELVGARTVACVELTGACVPATFFFSLAARRVSKKSDARALNLLAVVAGLYFAYAGWWMVSNGVPDLGRTIVDDKGVCRQTTGYTCVAASMVTMLRAFGIEADETEMARLTRTQVGGGATDSRAVWALEEKVSRRGLRPCYRRIELAGLVQAPKPCLVQLHWGYFESHMVPVMSATAVEVIIGDPLEGERAVPASEFERDWKGAAIMLLPAR